MKILTQKEITDKKQSQVERDIIRAKETKEVLEKVTQDLAETEAKFNVALSNQRVRWLKEEEEAMDRLNSIRSEISALERENKDKLVLLDEREKKSYSLLIEAEKALDQAHAKEHAAAQELEKQEDLTDLLQNKLDSLSDRETDVEKREQKVTVRELAVEEERALIKKLSSELSIKLTNI